MIKYLCKVLFWQLVLTFLLWIPRDILKAVEPECLEDTHYNFWSTLHWLLQDDYYAVCLTGLAFGMGVLRMRAMPLIVVVAVVFATHLYMVETWCEYSKNQQELIDLTPPLAVTWTEFSTWRDLLTGVNERRSHRIIQKANRNIELGLKRDYWLARAIVSRYAAGAVFIFLLAIGELFAYV